MLLTFSSAEIFHFSKRLYSYLYMKAKDYTVTYIESIRLLWSEQENKIKNDKSEITNTIN